MEYTLMKRLWLIAILVASASACVEGNNPVQLLSAIPQNPESCEPGTVALTHGRLNYAVGTSYVTTFQLFSPIAGDESSQASPAAFYAEEIIYNYESRNPPVSFTEESLPIYFVVPAGAQPGDSWLAMNLIGSKAREKLNGAVPAAPDSMTLLASIRVRGRFPSGKQVETNEVTYPIELTRAGGCTPPQVPARPAEAPPCLYPGQDAAFNTYTCVTPGG
jgi:hypothetical protein